MKRIREVYDAWTVSKLWSNQSQAQARTASKNFFFNGPTLYSYGHHFIVGHILPWGILLDDSDCSVTTRKHQRLSRQVTRNNGHLIAGLSSEQINSPRCLALQAAAQAAEFLARALSKRSDWRIRYELKQARRRAELCKLATAQAPYSLRKAILKTLPRIPDPGTADYESLKLCRDFHKRAQARKEHVKLIPDVAIALEKANGAASTAQAQLTCTTLAAMRLTRLHELAKVSGLKIPRKFPKPEVMRLAADSMRALYGISA